MLTKKQYFALFFILVFVAFSLLSCAPGNERWDEVLNPDNKAGFWAGVWHGIIVIITFIVSLFTKEVGIYEISNTGWPYNLGFILGLSCSVGGGIRFGIKSRKHRKRKYEWDDIGERVEEKVRKGIKAWLDESKKEEKDKEWEEIAEKIEEKIKKALREWVDK